MFFKPGRKSKRNEDEDHNEKKKELEETAKVYAEFVKSFQGDEDEESEKFVRSGDTKPIIYQPPGKPGWTPAKSEPSLKSEDSLPSPAVASGGLENAGAPTLSKKDESSFFGGKKEKTKHTREIDSFLEEIKQRQDMHQFKKQLKQQVLQHPATTTGAEASKLLTQLEPGMKGSRPGFLDDDVTTNLYLGNLSMEVTEEFICQKFSQFGAVQSVKLMYPRTEEEKSRGRLCGFCSFYARASAEEAKRQLDGAEIFGLRIRIGWGKSVARGAEAPSVEEIEEQMYGAAIQEVPPIQVQVPSDPYLRTTIDIVARFVAEDGHQLEQHLMDQRRHDPKFSFLFEFGSSVSLYYRWRVFSFANGDTFTSWRVKPVKIFTGGPNWVPPPCAESKSAPEPPAATGEQLPAAEIAADVEDDEEMLLRRDRSNEVGGGKMPEAEVDRWVDILRNVTTTRRSICEGMVFALESVSCAIEVSALLAESLLSVDASVRQKIARLYLISDILANAQAGSVKKGWVYRGEFERRLPELFYHLNDVSKRVERLHTAQLLQAAQRVLQNWHDRGTYLPIFLKGLEAVIRFQPRDFIPLQSGEKEPEPEPPDMTEDRLGRPLPADIYDRLRRLPYWLRRKWLEWRRYDVSKLQRVCRLHGIPRAARLEVPDLAAENTHRRILLQRLALYEAYWHRKELQAQHEQQREVSQAAG